MSEWVSAAIGAGSAVVGGVVTGWFTRSAGYRQADAAAHAGNRQADAMISTVRETLDEQRAHANWEARRAVYVQFLDALGSASASPLLTSSNADPTAPARAFLLIELEGPPEVVRCAKELADAAIANRRNRPGVREAFEEAREAFIQAAQAALVR